MESLRHLRLATEAAESTAHDLSVDGLMPLVELPQGEQETTPLPFFRVEDVPLLRRLGPATVQIGAGVLEYFQCSLDELFIVQHLNDPLMTPKLLLVNLLVKGAHCRLEDVAFILREAPEAAVILTRLDSIRKRLKEGGVFADEYRGLKSYLARRKRGPVAPPERHRRPLLVPNVLEQAATLCGNEPKLLQQDSRGKPTEVFLIRQALCYVLAEHFRRSREEVSLILKAKIGYLGQTIRDLRVRIGDDSALQERAKRLIGVLTLTLESQPPRFAQHGDYRPLPLEEDPDGAVADSRTADTHSLTE